MASLQGRMLSAQELVQYRSKVEKILPTQGKKDFKPSGSWLESKQIQSILYERKDLLQEERVEKIGTLLEAEWDEELLKARVTRKTGKQLETFGHEVRQELYFYPEEALFLLENNHLELLYGGVAMSVQQGYSTLLYPNTDCSLDEYRVYSQLMRQGYRLLRHTFRHRITRYERMLGLHHYIFPSKEKKPRKESRAFVESNEDHEEQVEENSPVESGDVKMETTASPVKEENEPENRVKSETEEVVVDVENEPENRVKSETEEVVVDVENELENRVKSENEEVVVDVENDVEVMDDVSAVSRRIKEDRQRSPEQEIHVVESSSNSQSCEEVSFKSEVVDVENDFQLARKKRKRRGSQANIEMVDLRDCDQSHRASGFKPEVVDVEDGGDLVKNRRRRRRERLRRNSSTGNVQRIDLTGDGFKSEVVPVQDDDDCISVISSSVGTPRINSSCVDSTSQVCDSSFGDSSYESYATTSKLQRQAGNIQVITIDSTSEVSIPQQTTASTAVCRIRWHSKPKVLSKVLGDSPSGSSAKSTTKEEESVHVNQDDCSNNEPASSVDMMQNEETLQQKQEGTSDDQVVEMNQQGASDQPVEMKEEGASDERAVETNQQGASDQPVEVKERPADEQAVEVKKEGASDQPVEVKEEGPADERAIEVKKEGASDRPVKVKEERPADERAVEVKKEGASDRPVEVKEEGPADERAVEVKQEVKQEETSVEDNLGRSAVNVKEEDVKNENQQMKEGSPAVDELKDNSSVEVFDISDNEGHSMKENRKTKNIGSACEGNRTSIEVFDIIDDDSQEKQVPDVEVLDVTDDESSVEEEVSVVEVTDGSSSVDASQEHGQAKYGSHDLDEDERYSPAPIRDMTPSVSYIPTPGSFQSEHQGTEDFISLETEPAYKYEYDPHTVNKRSHSDDDDDVIDLSDDERREEEHKVDLDGELSKFYEAIQEMDQEEERRRDLNESRFVILDSFPNAFGKTEIHLSVPPARLLPKNVCPNKSHYIIPVEKRVSPPPFQNYRNRFSPNHRSSWRGQRGHPRNRPRKFFRSNHDHEGSNARDIDWRSRDGENRGGSDRGGNEWFGYGSNETHRERSFGHHSHDRLNSEQRTHGSNELQERSFDHPGMNRTNLAHGLNEMRGRSFDHHGMNRRDSEQSFCGSNEMQGRSFEHQQTNSEQPGRGLYRGRSYGHQRSDKTNRSYGNHSEPSRRFEDGNSLEFQRHFDNERVNLMIPQPDAPIQFPTSVPVPQINNLLSVPLQVQNVPAGIHQPSVNWALSQLCQASYNMTLGGTNQTALMDTDERRLPPPQLPFLSLGPGFSPIFRRMFPNHHPRGRHSFGKRWNRPRYNRGRRHFPVPRMRPRPVDETRHAVMNEDAVSSSARWSPPRVSPESSDEEEIDPLVKPSECTSVGSILEQLQIIKSTKLESVSSLERVPLVVRYDLYLPDTVFRKSNPSLPDFRLLILRSDEAFPSPGRMAILQREYHDDIPFLIAVVIPDAISFFQYSAVSLPVEDFSSLIG